MHLKTRTTARRLFAPAPWEDPPSWLRRKRTRSRRQKRGKVDMRRRQEWQTRFRIKTRVLFKRRMEKGVMQRLSGLRWPSIGSFVTNLSSPSDTQVRNEGEHEDAINLEDLGSPVQSRLVLILTSIVSFISPTSSFNCHCQADHYIYRVVLSTGPPLKVPSTKKLI